MLKSRKSEKRLLTRDNFKEFKFDILSASTARFMRTYFFLTKAPPKRSKHFKHNIAQHCWSSICKLRLNDYIISTQHIAILLGLTCCARLATLLRHVATCLVLKIELMRMPGRKIFARAWPCNIHKCTNPQNVA